MKSTQAMCVSSSSWSPERRSAKTTPMIAMYSVMAPRTASKSALRFALGTTTVNARIAIASTLLWIVKKLKKFPTLKSTFGSLFRYEN